MKRLYFLNEAEKERILRLHKSKQIGKFWLNEQDDLPKAKTIGDPDTYAVATPYPNGTWSQEAKDEFMGYIDSYTTSEYAGYAVRPTVAKIKNFCETQIDQMGGPSIAVNKILLNAKNHESFMIANSRSGFGIYQRGVTDAAGFVPMIKQLENIPNLCYSIRNYKNLRGSETIADIYDEIYYDSNFQKYVLETLRILALQTKVAKPLKTKVKTGGGGVEGEEGSDWEKAQLEFYETYPCLTDIARASRAKNAVVVQNPSEHKQIMDKSQGKPTTITDQTTFFLDGTYQTATDRNRGEFSGKFECDGSGEYVMLYPGKVGLGKEGGIFEKWPCLGKDSSSGRPYTTVDTEDNNEALMEDELRLEHPIFSGYPSGEIYFYSDGTFLIEKDADDKETTGRFKCSKNKKKIIASPYSKATTPVPSPGTEEKKTGGGGGVVPITGMGVVSASSADITEILKCANIGGTTLNQAALNKLYEFIKNNKK